MQYYIYTHKNYYTLRCYAIDCTYSRQCKLLLAASKTLLHSKHKTIKSTNNKIHTKLGCQTATNTHYSNLYKLRQQQRYIVTMYTSYRQDPHEAWSSYSNKDTQKTFIQPVNKTFTKLDCHTATKMHSRYLYKLSTRPA